MSQQQVIEVKVPDIGDFTDVPVIDVLVKPGDAVAKEDPLVTLESDKATMEVPAPAAGVVKELKVKVGDKVSEGAPILTLEAAPAAKPGAAAFQPARAAARVPTASPPSPALLPSEQKGAPSIASGAVEVRVPDIGDFTDVPVIEVMVKAGDRVAKEDPLITLESDKATMEVPAPAGGVVKEVKVKVGDKVSEGALIVVVEVAAGAGAPSKPSAALSAGAPAASAPPAAPPAVPAPAPTHAPEAVDEEKFARAHASPSVRRLARELGVNLGLVKGSGPKGRILTDDVQAYVKGELAKLRAAAPAAAGGAGLDLLAWPKVDFTKFGPVEAKPLSRIKKISRANLHRNWVMIPHVTQFDEADVTELEAFRVQTNKEIEKSGVKLTMLAFLIKACVVALQKYPEFNASLDGDNLVLKRYYHIGFAADTRNGLVVPVLKDADAKGTVRIAKEMGELAAKARDAKLGPAEMQGGSFSISSLGGIGGTAFTPIINAPEVAILGVSKSVTKPVWNGKDFVPRLTLPLSLSYDHRVIDGAAAARFTSYLVRLLADMRRVIL
jgi:pyruvate dehydrogenase E2 component (dihydrolipoamide acetyltransferase)